MTIQHNQISRKFVEPGQRNLSWKKGGLAVSQTTLHWELARNKGLLNLFDCHLAISRKGVEQAIIPHLKEGYLDYLLIQNFWIFTNKLLFFKHVFELGWPHQGEVHILGCHIATSHSRQGYHTSFERWYSGLSYDTKCLNIFGEIAM